MADKPRDPLTYRAAGVDLEARQRVVQRYREVAKLLKQMTEDGTREEGEPEDIGELEEWLKARKGR